MRVELLATLKSGKKMYYKGRVFDEPLPASIQAEVVLCRQNPQRKTVRVLDEPIQPQQSIAATVMEVEKTVEAAPSIPEVKEIPVRPLRRRTAKR